MRDKISEGRVNALHPAVRQIFKTFIETCEEKENITLRVSEGFRSIAYQNGLYAQGRTKPGKIVTKATGGQSFHNYGLAIDLVRMVGKEVDWSFDMAKLVKYMPAGMVWGGNFKSIKDKPHFEMTFGNTWRTLLLRYQKKDFVSGEFVRL